MVFVPAKENPFRTERTHAVPFRFPEGDWSAQLNRLEALNWRAGIVGRRGSGKSTLLRQLRSRLESEGHSAIYLNFPLEKTPQVTLFETGMAAGADGSILLIDGIERLSYLRRRQLLRKTKTGAGLVIAQHHPNSLPTWIHCQTSRELLLEVLTELNLDHADIVRASQLAFEKSKGNIRDVLREMYDRYSEGEFAG